jgi:hypothetical protein
MFKMIKRQVYGRASFPLLRKRVILHPCVTTITKFAQEPENPRRVRLAAKVPPQGNCLVPRWGSIF